MPKFLDYHAKLPQMPPEAMNEVAGRVKAGKPDQFGVKPLNLFLGKGGQAYCLTEAPSLEAVIKSHQANGVPVNPSDIVEVTSLA